MRKEYLLMKEIYFAGGCFWGVEKYLSLIPGVTHTEVGYANGHTLNPTYEEVCEKDTGHVEAVKVLYDPTHISLTFLLELFFESIDPTSLNKQGEDEGSQYRSGIYYIDESDLELVRGTISKLQEEYSQPIVVEALPLSCFFPAEEYHQKYLDKNPTGYCHIGEELFAKAASPVRNCRV
jgi:peptide methionine sulfoxide reductase msrA/msrB